MTTDDRPQIETSGTFDHAGSGGVDDRELANKMSVEAVQAIDLKPRIAIVVSGVRSNADWVDRVISQSEQFAQDEIKFVKAKTARIPVWRLATRCGLSRDRERIKDQIFNTIIANCNAEISLICHSLGTDLVADCLKDINHKFEHIVLLGSICKTSKLHSLSKSCSYLINDRSSHDKFSIVAGLVLPWSYEATGTFGFKSGHPNDRVFLNDHDSCAEADHIFKAVVPRLLGQTRLDKDLYSECAFSHHRFAYAKTAFRSLITVSASCVVIWLYLDLQWLLEVTATTLFIALAIPLRYLLRKTTVRPPTPSDGLCKRVFKKISYVYSWLSQHIARRYLV